MISASNSSEIPVSEIESSNLPCDSPVILDNIIPFRYWKIPALVLLGLFVFYLCMFLKYRPYDVDNPWFLSFSYDTCVEHVNSDQFLNVKFPAGMDGTQLFGKLAAYTQCGVLSYAGWRQWPAATLSSMLVLLSLAMWGLQFRRLGYSIRFILCFLVVAGVSEPFLSTANKFRYECLSFTLISLGLLLVAYRRPFWGIFAAALAIEIEPMALLGVLPVLVLAFSIHKLTCGLLARLAGGLALAGALYLTLHPNVVHLGYYLLQVKEAGKTNVGGFFRSYFLERRRHLPELICFIAAAIIYWFRRHTVGCHYLAVSALVITVFSIVMPHGNSSYMIFLYPFLVAMMLIAFRADHRHQLIIALAILYVFPQYAYLVYINREQGYRPQDIRQVSDAIASASQQLGISDSRLRIYGDYGLWFAHPHFYRAASITTLGHIHDADLYVCYDSWNSAKISMPQHMLYCSDLRQRLSLRLLSKTLIRNNMVYLYAKG